MRPTPRRLVPPALLPALLLLAAPTFAADISAASSVTAATVFPSGARVTRTATVSLPAGESVVVFPDLPAAAPPDTLQVDGASATELTVVSVGAAKAFLTGPAPEREAALTDQLEKLADQRRQVTDHTKALQEQLAFIHSLAQAAPPTAKDGLISGTPNDWPAAWTLIGKGAQATYADIQAQDQATRDLDRRIDKLKKELNQVRTGATHRLAVRIHVQAKAAAPARLAVTYQVPAASWSPVYDARLDPEAARLELTLRAQVRQHTGEDWTDAALTLSTARPSAGAAMTEPVPWFVGRREELDLAKAQGFVESRGVLRVPARNMPRAPAVAMEAPAEEQAAETVTGEFALAYAIKGPQTVPADGVPHRFAADVREFPVKLQVRAQPRAEERAYLYAVLTNDGAPLPGGPVSLFRGGALVGRAAFSEMPPGDEQRLPFGVDDRVTVTHKIDKDLSGTHGLFGKRERVERRQVIEVESFHARPVEITVYDRLPVPRQEQIEVKYLDAWATPPTETDWQGLKGVLAWTRTYAPREKGEIRFGYTVSYPEGWSVPGF